MTGDPAILRALASRAAPDPVGAAYGRDPAPDAADGRALWPWWCKAQAAWSAGNTVSVKPCTSGGTLIDGASALTAYVTTPTGGSPGTGLEPAISAGDVLAYRPWGSTAALLLNVKWTVTGAEAAVTAMTGYALGGAWFFLASDGAATLDANDWRGRVIDWAVCWDTNPPAGIYANAEVGATFTKPTQAGAIPIKSVAAGGDQIDVYVDGNDSGKLKLATVNAVNNLSMGLRLGATEAIYGT